MAVTVSEVPTAEVAIGTSTLDRVIAGDSWSRRFRVQDKDDCTLADFTGFTPAFELLDNTGAVVQTGTVVPSPGDATGEFLASLTTAQVLEGNFAYSLRVTDGATITKTLFCGPFQVTDCKADP